MDDPSLALQVRVVALLRGDASLAGLVGNRIYDRVPADAVMPYVAMTGWQTISEDAECFEAWEVYFDVQCFSTEVGRPEVARIAGAVKSVLHKAAIATGGDAAISHNNTLYFVDDGLTQRAVVNFRALVD